MAIGMSPEEFWHGPARLCRAYREAWKIRRDNRFAAEWRQGMYTQAALSVALDHAFNKDAKSEYPDAPLWSSEQIRKEAEERRAREEMEAQMRRVDLWAAQVNKRFADRERQGEEGA